MDLHAGPRPHPPEPGLTPAAETDPEAGPSARSEAGSPGAIWLLTGLMALVAVALAAPTFLADPGAALPDLWWVVLLPVFALAEVVVIHLPTQRNAHGHTWREIPAVLGLTFLAPEQYVSAYVVGAGLALLLAARMRGVKLVFNLAMFSLEAVLGALTYHAVLQGGDPLSPHGWLAVLLAVLVTDLMSAAAVTAAISLTEGAFDGGVLEEALVSGSVAAFINTCIALVVATLVLVRPSAVALLAVVVVLLVVGYRSYIALARGHAQTQLLYRFVERTSAARSNDELLAVLLREAAGLMHAERAFLLEVSSDGAARVSRLVDDAVSTETLAATAPEAWWWPALDGGVVQHVRPPANDDGPAATTAASLLADPRDGLAARLGADATVTRVLAVCDRSFSQERFGDEDVQVYETLAAHAGVALDRTRTVADLEQLAAELEDARDAALAASRAKSLFLANMSHEIRTPLTVMLAAAEMLEDTDLDAEQVSLLERTHRAGGSLKTLVEGILDFSRLESGTVELATRPFVLRPLVDDVASVYGPRAVRAGIEFSAVVDPQVPQELTSDPGRLFQVLANLVDNALKFTAQGEVGLRVGLRRGGPAGDEVEVVVSDTGIGIAPEHRATIFDVFSQVDPSTTRSYDGTGLGLAICRQLVELLGGTIDVESEPGVGSTFAVRLPLR